MDDYTIEEKRILSLPVGELTKDEFEVLKDIFVKNGFSPPIIIKGGVIDNDLE